MKMCPEMTEKDEGGEYFSLSIGFTMPPPWHTTGSLLQRNWWEVLESTVQRWYMGWRSRTTSEERGGLKGAPVTVVGVVATYKTTLLSYVRHYAENVCNCLLWPNLNPIVNSHLNVLLSCWLSCLDVRRPRLRCEHNLINTPHVFIQNLHSRNFQLV